MYSESAEIKPAQCRITSLFYETLISESFSKKECSRKFNFHQNLMMMMIIITITIIAIIIIITIIIIIITMCTLY